MDLQQILNVDLSHVEARVNDMVKHDHNLTLILGQLIDRYCVIQGQGHQLSCGPQSCGGQGQQ